MDLGENQTSVVPHDIQAATKRTWIEPEVTSMDLASAELPGSL